MMSYNDSLGAVIEAVDINTVPSRRISGRLSKLSRKGQMAEIAQVQRCPSWR